MREWGGTSRFLSLIRPEALGPLEPPKCWVRGARPYSRHCPQITVPQVNMQALLRRPGWGPRAGMSNAGQPPSCWLGSHLEGQGLRGTSPQVAFKEPLSQRLALFLGSFVPGAAWGCLLAFGPESRSPPCR